MEEKELIERIGANIRRFRKKKGMKQTELAYTCGFEKQNMQRIEAGKTNPTVKTLHKIAEALGVTIIELLT